MNKFLLVLFAFSAFSSCEPVWADTPPPGTVGIKGATDGTSIGNVADALKVDVVNSGASTFNQGAPAPAPSAWPVYAPSPVPVVFPTPQAVIFPSPQAVTVNNFPSNQNVTIQNSSLPVTQLGTWTFGRTWTLNQSTDSIDSWLFDGTGHALSSSGGGLLVNLGTIGSAATAANQTTMISDLGTLVSQTVGLATSALQSAGNALLTTISSTLTTISGAVSTAANQVLELAQLTTIATNTGTTASNTTSILADLTNGTQTTQVTSLPAVAQGTPGPQASPWPTTQVDGQKATYTAAYAGLAPAATATDIFTLTGSATKTVRVTFIQVTATRTTSGPVLISLLKRLTADTGGTGFQAVTAQFDSSDPAPTAVGFGYATNPTVGVSGGFFRIYTQLVNPQSTTDAVDPIQWTFGNRPGSRAIVLRGIAQQIALSLNSTTVTGGSYNIIVEWTEE